MITPFHDPAEGPLRVVGLMSGSGTNIRKIIEHQKYLEKEEGASPFEMVVLFSDRWDSNATRIGNEYDIPVLTRDIGGFYTKKGKRRSDLSIRPEFDQATANALEPFDVKVGVYGGYMSVATMPLLEAFLGINVHPADLSIEQQGKRKYTGDHAVRDAIAAGEKTIAASTHIIEEHVDQGRLFMISAPIDVVLKDRWDIATAAGLAEAESYNQDRLKENGDWIIFPKTVEYIARGRFGHDESGLLYFDGKAIPKGLRL